MWRSLWSTQSINTKPLMSHYDAIASVYNAHRSDSIGVATVSRYIDTLGWDSSVLDMGCGTGKPIAMAIAGKVRAYTGVDVSPDMASAFRRALPTATCIVADLAAVDLGSTMYDLCFSWGALCHLEPEDQRSALAKAICHTKPGGLILFTGSAEKGMCDGYVGPHQICHYSLGAAAYDDVFVSQGCKPKFKGEVEGGAAYLFVYHKLA